MLNSIGNSSSDKSWSDSFRIPITSDQSNLSSNDRSYKQRPCACKARVLLVDDNPFNLIPLSFMMEKHYNVYCHVVYNGKLAVAEFI